MRGIYDNPYVILLWWYWIKRKCFSFVFKIHLTCSRCYTFDWVHEHRIDYHIWFDNLFSIFSFFHQVHKLYILITLDSASWWGLYLDHCTSNEGSMLDASGDMVETRFHQNHCSGGVPWYSKSAADDDIFSLLQISIDYWWAQCR